MPAKKIIRKAEKRVGYKRPNRREPTDQELFLIQWYLQELTLSVMNMGRYANTFINTNDPVVTGCYIREKEKIRTLKASLRAILSGL